MMQAAIPTEAFNNVGRYEALMEIVSWDRFNQENFMTDAQIDEWVRTSRHKVMYRDESKVD